VLVEIVIIATPFSANMWQDFTGFWFPVHVLSPSPFRLFSVGARPLLGERNHIGSTRAIRSQRFECAAGGRTATWNCDSFE